MKLNSYIFICALFFISSSAFAQGWIDAPSGSGLKLRTAPFCMSEGSSMRIWGDIFEYTQGIPTDVKSITDLSGKIYTNMDEVAPTGDIGFIIQSTLYDISYTDTVDIAVANSPKAELVSSSNQTVCRNSMVDEPIINTYYVDTQQWQSISAPAIPISFPFAAVNDTIFRLAYANSVCGYKYVNIFITVIDTLSISKFVLRPFDDIQDVCRSCYFPLPNTVTADEGIVMAADINWFIPDSPVYQDTFRYGIAKITVRGDSNICGYKTKILDTHVQVKVKTIDCYPRLAFDASPVCYCDIYNFGITSDFPRYCIYTEDSIQKIITPNIPFDTVSVGSYNLKIRDSFEVFLKVNANLQCPTGALYPTVQKSVSGSKYVKIDDSKCPVPVEYTFCKGDSGFIKFRNTTEKY
ncbi:MAG: hypothetical protein LBF01_03835, partial [Bacteroidales bacterium]|nr:hypothetical protein [Bacteroidales bacterium]